MFETKEVKAVLVDMDGTLADGMELLFSSYMNLLASHGFQGSKEEFEELTGPKMDEILEILNKRYKLTPDTSTLFAEYHQTLRDTYAKSVPLFPGAVDFLEFVKEKRLKLALVTSADKDLANKFLTNHQIKHLFEVIVTPEGLMKGKPSSEVYAKALEELGVEPEYAVAIEDSYNGVQSAIGIGIHTIHILHYPEQSTYEFEKGYTVAYGWQAVQAMLEEGQ